MENVSICPVCGRTIESAFVFCPWCGTASEEETTLGEQLDSVFLKMEVSQRKHAFSRIDRIQNELGELEKELSELLSLPHPR